MFLIVGLGNVGKKYDNTYHNMGFSVIDSLAGKYDIKMTKKRGNALVFVGKIAGKKVVLAKPQTFMNLSGTSVKSLLKKYKIELNNMIVVYDDVDLEPGEVRFRNSGSAGTHNGMRNIIQHTSSKEFKRIRIGIGKGKGDLAKFVLSHIKKENQEEINVSKEKAVNLLEDILKNNGELENKSA